MKSYSFIVPVLFSIALLSCAAPYNKNFPLVEKGMGLAQVSELIGDPISAESGPEDTKVLYYRLASSPLDTDGSDTREYFIVTKSKTVIGYGERTDKTTMMREARQFNAAWNLVDSINDANPNP